MCTAMERRGMAKVLRGRYRVRYSALDRVSDPATGSV